MAHIATCTHFSASQVCEQITYIEGVVVTQSQLDALSLFSGFDMEMFRIGFGGTLAVFAVGLSVGLITNLIRKGK
ncbi:hypothetical protein HZU75_16635 [Chitinibacter fontanus]|uniref:Uncharacterized protein n=1 Tax=Chitinibacter fontanus TaxID=1737446 RepID=A0A7D5VC63_9NEIS|nr:hypothetical protein [Chitinibacter fontanus]QLI83018.1 hypothetical protein HZU75_16635 [Chitinibacter fontanus]